MSSRETVTCPISYLRTDEAFVQRLFAALHERDVWVDWEEIPVAAEQVRQLTDNFAVVEVVETPAPARRRTPRRASWRELPAAEMAAHLLETPTIGDRVWTDELRLPRETRTAFIRRVLLGEVEAAEVAETETAS
jgi:hypothetical protein